MASSQRVVKWKRLNLITLGPHTLDHTNRLITIIDDFYLLAFSKWDQFNLITICRRLITLSVELTDLVVLILNVLTQV